MKIGEVTSPSTGNPYLLGQLGCMFDEHHPPIAPSGMRRTHEAGCARSDHGDIEMLQSGSRRVVAVRAQKLFSIEALWEPKRLFKLFGAQKNIGLGRLGIAAFEGDENPFAPIALAFEAIEPGNVVGFDLEVENPVDGMSRVGHDSGICLRDNCTSHEPMRSRTGGSITTSHRALPDFGKHQ